MTDSTIGFIGGGNMARSLISGLLGSGYRPEQLLIADPNAGQREALASHFAVAVHADNLPVARLADVVILAVKPQVMKQALDSVRTVVAERQPLLVSIAAGIQLAHLTAWSTVNTPIIRVMPNTPSLVGAGAAGLYANAHVSAAQRDLAESIMRAVGIVLWVDREELIDAVTATSGSGPAYFFYLMEAIEKAATECGLPAADARLLVTQTALGAARLASETNESLTTLRNAVTSPGGATEKALGVMRQASLARVVGEAVHAARERSVDLADLLGKD